MGITEKSFGQVSKNFERQYAESLQNLLDNGVLSDNRTGINTLSLQHQYFHIENILQSFPIIKGKKVFPYLALKELMWMMNGRSDIAWLNTRGVKYWDKWSSTGEGKHAHIPVGTIGKSYGYQMRNFNGADQLLDMLKEMSSNPTSRRLKITLWNPADLNDTTLPPCVDYYHFGCVPMNDKKAGYYVDLHVHARSEDSFLGQPYDFMSAGWMLLILCHIAERMSNGCFYFVPRDIHYTADDYHLYANHIEQAKQYIANVVENKRNVIDAQACVSVGSNHFTSLDSFLKMSDDNKYSNFWTNKFYEEMYGQIEAEVAV